MQYELSEEIIKVLDDLAKRFGVAIDWADKNVMPYLMDLYERFIDYKIITNLIPIVLFVIFLMCSIIFFIKYYKNKNLVFKTEKSNLFIEVVEYKYKDNEYTLTQFSLIAGGLLVVSLILSGLWTIFSIGGLLELIFVPEVYVIEYLSTFM
jgi:hypothetical protein